MSKWHRLPHVMFDPLKPMDKRRPTKRKPFKLPTEKAWKNIRTDSSLFTMESRLIFDHFLPCANSAPHDAPRPGRRSRGTPNMERADGSWLYMHYSYRKTNENQWIHVRSQFDLMIPKRPASWCPGRSVAFVRLSVPYLGSIFFDEQIWDGTEHILPTDESERLAARNKQFHQPTIYT